MLSKDSKLQKKEFEESVNGMTGGIALTPDRIFSGRKNIAWKVNKEKTKDQTYSPSKARQRKETEDLI